MTGAQAKPKANAPSYTNVFADTLIDEARRDPTIVAVTAAMPDGTGLFELTDSQPANGSAAQFAQTAARVSQSLVGQTVADVERDLILDTLDHVLGNRTHAATILGISIRTLRNKLNQYADEGLDIPAPGEQRSNAA